MWYNGSRQERKGKTMKIKPFTRAWYIKNWIVFIVVYLPIMFAIGCGILFGAAALTQLILHGGF
jgi:hypothetical protein